jgi:hypothetical protein
MHPFYAYTQGVLKAATAPRGIFASKHAVSLMFPEGFDWLTRELLQPAEDLIAATTGWMQSLPPAMQHAGAKACRHLSHKRKKAPAAAPEQKKKKSLRKKPGRS